MTNTELGMWAAGFADGEGCFTLAVYRIATHRQNLIAWKFTIRLRDDDVATLHKIRDVMGGVGNIYFNDNKGNGNSKPGATFAVGGRSDIAKVVKFFRQFPLQSKKQRDFQLWATAFDYYQSQFPVGKTSGSHWPEEVLNRLSEYAAAIKIVRTYVGVTRAKQSLTLIGLDNPLL